MDIDLPNSLKRCLSAPIINNLPNPVGSNINVPSVETTTTQPQPPITTTDQHLLNQQIQRKVLNSLITETAKMTSKTIPSPQQVSSNCSSPQRPQSREASPGPILNIFAPRARRYSASFTPLVGGNNNTGTAAGNNGGPRLTPRVSQLRQEECIDMNSREVNHEREVHSAMQISQSWEDLTLVAENWSCKSDDMSNPLQVTLPPVNGFGNNNCSSPSPTSRAAGMRLPYGLSPSPTRRTFATRRSMSPIAMRPSPLGPVKRKFELDDSNWNSYSPPPFKKIFTESSRGSSPICQSPDSGTYDGRITPKFLSKLCTTSTSATNSASSMCSSPGSMLDSGLDIQSNSSSTSTTNNNILPSSSSSSSSSSTNDKSEIMNIVCSSESQTINDEGITTTTESTNLIMEGNNTKEIKNNLHININSKKNNPLNEDTLMLDEEKISSNNSYDRIVHDINKLPNWKESIRHQQSDSSESTSSTSSLCFGVKNNNFSNLGELSKSGKVNNNINDQKLIVKVAAIVENNPT